MELIFQWEETENTQDVNKIYIMFEGDQCYEKQETKEGIKISGVGRVEILQKMSWQTIYEGDI